MTLAFAGPATPLDAADLAIAARWLDCDVPTIKAVMTVETNGSGFIPDDRPEILFEALHFGEATKHVYDQSHPTISSSTWNPHLYRLGALEYDRLNQAVALNRAAALSSTSWGLFQILGENYKEAGYPDVESFVAAMSVSEGAHLSAFVSFCQSTGCAAYLKDRDWARFARSYNGPGYAQNAYDTKLAAAYNNALAGSQPLQIGTTGPAVKAMQNALIAAGAFILADGNFGRSTDLALMRFQAAHGITADGICGPVTAKLLSISL